MLDTIQHCENEFLIERNINALKASNFGPSGNCGPFLARFVASSSELCTN
jgi:hypothetical protein